MANTFKNASVLAGTSATVLYTCPSSTTAVVHRLLLANIDSLNDISVTVSFFDSSSSTTRVIGNSLPIPQGSGISFPTPLNLEDGDQILVQCSSVSALNAYASVLEIS